MWKVEFNPKNKRYYLHDTKSGKKRIVPKITPHEIEIERYQQYYDKAYVKAEYLNNQPVYHTRVVNGKKYMYKMLRSSTRSH